MLLRRATDLTLINEGVARTVLHVSVHRLATCHQLSLVLPELLQPRPQLTLRLLEYVGHDLLGTYLLVLKDLLIVVQRAAFLFVLIFIADQETIDGTGRNWPTTAAIEAYLVTFKQHVARLLDARFGCILVWALLLFNVRSLRLQLAGFTL